MNSVYKYPLWPSLSTAHVRDDVRGDVSIDLPKGAQPLRADVQAGAVVLWALVDPDAVLERRRFRIAGTGHPLDDGMNYISTFYLQGGALVFHVFEWVDR